MSVLALPASCCSSYAAGPWRQAAGCQRCAICSLIRLRPAPAAAGPGGEELSCAAGGWHRHRHGGQRQHQDVCGAAHLPGEWKE
jgi:hypothetical protein